jgi:protein-S-isoprenylcysteine O-methyltransferase Ste14
MIASTSVKGARPKTTLKSLIGSGDRIGLFTLPLLVAGVVLNILFPQVFQVGGPPVGVQVIAIVLLVTGVVIWAWSVVLILTKVPRGELITHGPYALVKHPLYTAVALLVLPWIGVLVDTWVGAAIGITMYLVSRECALAEEAELSKRFGAAWDVYRNAVKLPWM